MKQKRRDKNAGDFSGLSNPAQRALAAARITRLEDLAAFTEQQIRVMHGIGPKTIKQLRTALAARRISYAKAKRSA